MSTDAPAFSPNADDDEKKVPSGSDSGEREKEKIDRDSEEGLKRKEEEQAQTRPPTGSTVGRDEKDAVGAAKAPVSTTGDGEEKVADSAAETKQEEQEVEIEYLPPLRLALLTFGLAMVIFVVALDNTIIATAIPTITTVFNSLNDVGWYGSSYLLTTTSLQPSFGKIYQYFNVKWTYLSALVLFEIGSIICATAVNSPMLIVGRAVAGAGASALFSGGMTIIGFAVPLRKVPIYIAALSSMFGIASVVGPILGGVLTDKVSWRWCFWINLPFGAVAFLAVFAFFKPPKRKSSNLKLSEKLKKIDMVGAFFLIGAIVCLLLALQDGGTTYPWSSSRIWGLLLGFALIIIVFILIQVRRGENATIPMRLFLRQRTILTGSIFSCFLSMGLYTHIYYVPFYFQAVKGVTAENSGIRSIPYLVSITLSSLLVGAFVTKTGYYVPFLWIGSAVFAIGAGLLFTLKVGSSAGQWIGYQIVAGFGAGAGVQVPFVAVQASISAKDMPVGNALMIFFNSLGGAVSISIAQNVFSNSLVKSIPKYAPSVNPEAIIAAGATHIRDVVSSDQLAGVLLAYTYSLTRAFILPIATACAAFVASLFMEWNTVKGKPIVHSAAA